MTLQGFAPVSFSQIPILVEFQYIRRLCGSTRRCSSPGTILWVPASLLDE